MKKNFMLIVALAAMFFFAAPMTTEAAEGEGKWNQNATGWWYEFSDGSYLSDGMFEVDGEWYYFDAAGYMKTGWVWVEYDYGFEGDDVPEEPEITGDWYYFGNSGAMAKGWLQDGADWYYLDPEAGWMWTNSLVGDGTYYVGEDGKMVTDYWFGGEENTIYAFDASGRRVLGGWFQIVMSHSMQWTYIGTDGQMAEGWLQDGDAWYYLDQGLAKMGTYIMEYAGQEHLYQFATSGVLISDVLATKGWIQVDDTWYYYGDDGLVRGDWVYDGAWYHMNRQGRMETSTTISDHAEQCYYAVDASGKMVTNGWAQIHDSWVYADGTKGGKLVENDWLQLGTTWYYFDWCYMVDQPTFIGEQLSLFSASGAWLGYSNITNGWVAAYNSWYYLENGQFATGWRRIGDVWYYFDPDNYLAAVDGVWFDYNTGVPYLFNQNGAMTSGWYYSENMEIWFYANPDGTAIVSDWLQIGTTWYYFDYDGWMADDAIWEIDEKQHVFAKGGAWLGEMGNYSDGWQYLFGDWYYFEDGYTTYGLRKIDGQIYAFSDKMLTNDYWFVSCYSSVGTQLGNGAYLIALDGNGHLVKNQWKYLDELEEWVWFDSYGYGEMPFAVYY